MSNFVSYENGQTLFGAVGEKFDDVFATMGANGAKNYLPNKAASASASGVTFTVNSDGTVTADTNGGSASATAFLSIVPNNTFTLPKGTYYLSCGDAFIGNYNKYGMYLSDANSTIATTNNSNTFTLAADTLIKEARIFVASGQSVSNLVFKPMIRLATDPDSTYAPYAMTNKQLTDALAYLEQTVTLSTSAATAVTFTDARITANSCIEVGTSEWGLVPDSVTVSAGSCVVTLPQAETAHSVVCRIYLR